MDLNRQLFLLLNAPAHPGALLVSIALFVAYGIAIAAAALWVGLWVWGPPERRGALLATGLAVIAALAVNQLLGKLWFEPRPFMIGLGHTLAKHAPDGSFPSDHATFMWSLGLGLIATRAWRGWGWVVSVLGLAVAWSRIYLGLHFPIDMAGSLLVGLGAALVARAIRPVVEHHLMPVVGRAYDTVLCLLRLPPAVFPRTATIPTARHEPP